jgi:hypothetical protein
MKKLILVSTSIVLFSSCATIFIPKKEKLTINTGQSKSTVYIEKEEFGEGSSITGKVKKEGTKQVIIRTPGYKDQYNVLFPTHRPIAFWPLLIANTACYYGWMLDAINPKLISYDKINEFKINDNKLVTRTPTDKYIEISNISMIIKNQDKDIYNMPVKYSKEGISKGIEDAEKKKDSKEAKEELKKLKSKKKKGKNLDDGEDKVNYGDIKYSENVFKTLKNTGFIDTVNLIFSDNNNTLVLEGKVKKIYTYSIYKKRSFYNKAKLFMTWYVKNTYDEILDSIDTKDLSGDFVLYNYLDKKYSSDKMISTADKMLGDAVDISYLKLHKNPKLTKYLKQETNFEISDAVLTLPKPSASVIEKTDAASASVIIKRKDGGHGSGFAITNDGYIVTNYHVVAGKIYGKLSTITIITSEGEELEGTIVRTNKFRDLALIKVNKKFEKAFSVPSAKAFKNLQDVYTIGAPKSIELGQSVSTGVISNERKANNNYLLQLGMSVNGGNSGGPLYDATGKLHGVIVSKLIGKNTEGVSFAIPAHMIEQYLKLKIN